MELEKFFFPEKRFFKGIEIPSVPFVDKHNQTLYCSDVIKVFVPPEEESLSAAATKPPEYEHFVVELKKGSYYASAKKPYLDIPLSDIETNDIERIGNAVENPALLDFIVDY